MVYDQRNRKVLRFSSSGDYLEEFTLKPWEKGTLTEVYELDENHLLTVQRLEVLRGDYEGYHSIRVNAQWRIVFRWQDSNAFDVAIVEYH